MTSQAAAILRYLQRGRTLTPMEALHRFGSFRLGARIYELRAAGHAVRTTLVAVDSRRRVARYSLDRSGK